MILANLITLARLPLLFALLGILLYSSTWHWQMLGLGLLGESQILIVLQILEDRLPNHSTAVAAPDSRQHIQFFFNVFV